MKKIILSFLFIFCLTLPVLSAEFLPRYNDSIKDYGIGLYFGEGEATIYENPDEQSNVLARLKWDANKVYLNDKILEPKNVFGVFLPNNALSGFIAIDEEKNEYTKVIYDTSSGLSGWIKNPPDSKAFYWRQLFYKYGKYKGIYLFANVKENDKVLRLSPEDDADISYSFIYPKYIRLQLIKGNWALLKVLDYDNEQKVGWFKWRNQDGTLNAFPCFKD